MRGAGIVAYGGPVPLLGLPAPELSGPDQLLIARHAAGAGNWDDIVRTGGRGGGTVTSPSSRGTPVAWAFGRTSCARGAGPWGASRRWRWGWPPPGWSASLERRSPGSAPVTRS